VNAEAMDAEPMDEGAPATNAAEVVVYWRPGCGFCSMLFRDLDRLQVPYREVNIWQEPDAAAVVRSFARGNETVPTVVIGTVGLVNPGVHDVLAAAGVHAPAAVPAGYVAPEPGRFSSWLHSKLG
jgi:glutaredoxin